MKYSYEHKLLIVSRLHQGEAISHLSKEYHISKTQILAWSRMWDRYGRSGLEKQRPTHATPEFKENIVRLILEKGVPLSHIRIEYRIGKTALQRWVGIVRQQGYEGLTSKKGGDDHPNTLWEDLRKESHRPNLRSSRQRICV